MPTLQLLVRISHGLVTIPSYPLNIALIYYLWRQPNNVKSGFRTTITVSSIFYVIYSTLDAITAYSDVLMDDSVFLVPAGPVIFFSRFWNNIFFALWFYAAQAAWTVVAVNYILQYAIVSRRPITRSTIALIYLYEFILTVPGIAMMYLLYPTEETHQQLLATAQKFFDLPPTDTYVVYGTKMYPTPENNNQTLIPAIGAIIVSVACTYATVLVCTVKIRKKLDPAFITHKATLTLHRRFLKFQIAQAALPVVVCVVPLTIVVTLALSGVEINGASAIFNIIFPSFALFHAALYLAYARRTRALASSAGAPGLFEPNRHSSSQRNRPPPGPVIVTTSSSEK